MSRGAAALRLAEWVQPPDTLLRWSILRRVAARRRLLDSPPGNTDRSFAAAMAERPIAEFTDAANAQHYELPPEFFGLTLGPRRKYSCCLYPTGGETLAEAEESALAETAAHAGLADGQRILELGCGWGSLTLFMAERFPHARITAVSNAAPQRDYILAVARERGLTNVDVLTANMTTFEPAGGYDRIVSVEMFEHLANWRLLLEKLRPALAAEGRLFLHIFNHRSRAYRFDHRDKADWIGRYFFTGGMMPSDGLIRQYADLFAVEEEWRWSGEQYRRTAEDWLKRFDANRPAIDRVLADVYGSDARLWGFRWRLFYLATAGLFGFDGGEIWGVSHYRLAPA